MRVLADTRQIKVEPGTFTAFTVEITNTGDVIDGVSASVIGMSTELVSATPALLPLFPETAGRVTLGLTVPQSHPAGRHPLTVQVISHGTAEPPSHVDVDLDVEARPGLRLESRPRLIRARRSARCLLELTNTGNVPLDVTLTGDDPDRLVALTFAPEYRRIEPGGVAPVLLAMRGPRVFTGGETDRTILIQAIARPASGPLTEAPPVTTPDPRELGFFTGVPDDAAASETTVLPRIVEPLGGTVAPPPPEAELAPDTELTRTRTIQYRQRPTIGRGLLTILILLSIVAVWAGVFLLGLAKVFAADPMTKQAPASFFASLNSPSGTSGSAAPGSGNPSGTGANGSGSNGAGSNGSGAGSGGAAPAGALSKSGQLAPGMGGTITGTVTALNDELPVGRILVQAYRQGRTGLVRMSSAASQTDGTYALAGLFPTSYYLEFSATGFKTQWYPDRPTRSGAQLVPAVAQGTTSGIGATVVGLPATITGKIDPGDALTKVTTIVAVRALDGTKVGKAIERVKTDAGGNYTLTKLPAPADYELTFTTTGYQASTLVDTVTGGDKRLEPTVSLGASAGQITGTVTDGGQGLGGATVTTTVGGQPLSVMTPTTGQVGAFVLGNLATPATYVVTVSSPGRGSSTRIVDLTAGQSRNGLDFNLTSGAGSVAGHVETAAGKGLGGATVTVGGAATGSSSQLQATTLTDGDPGAFAINGLRAPGSYTLTVTLTGYSPASVPVTLSGAGAAPPVVIRLADQLGGVTGVVRGSTGGSILAGATVTATNGQLSFTTTSDTTDGGYDLTNLPPGSYSVTASAPGRHQQTALVDVAAGENSKQDLVVRA